MRAASPLPLPKPRTGGHSACLISSVFVLVQDPTLEFLRKFTIGLVSGTISSCVNIPFDVAKSRIQGPQPVPGEIKYRTCFQTMALVYREEG